MVYPHDGLSLGRKLPLHAIHVDESQEQHAEQKPSNETSYSLLFHLIATPEKTNLIYNTKQISGCLRPRNWGGLAGGGAWERCFEIMDTSASWQNCCYTGVYVCQNTSSCTFKIGDLCFALRIKSDTLTRHSMAVTVNEQDTASSWGDRATPRGVSLRNSIGQSPQK